LLAGDGPLLPEYKKLATTVVLRDARDFDEALRNFGPEFSQSDRFTALCNTTATGWIVPLLSQRGIRAVSLIHELDHFIVERGFQSMVRDIAKHAHTVVFSSAVVEAGFQTFLKRSPDRSVIRPQGIYQNVDSVVADRAAVFEKLKLPADARLVVNVGYGDLRKGMDLFVELSKRHDIFGPNVYFAWIGNREAPLEHWLRADPAISGADSRVRLVDFTDKALEYVAVADAFALTSREDPFPSVVIESLALGTPVIAFEGAGGFSDVVALEGNGRLVEKCNVLEMAKALAEIFRTDRVQARDARAMRARQVFDMAEYVFSLLEILYPDLVRVSAVITNFNHGKYLPQRLASVLTQTYPLYEVMLFDDCSQDDSIAIAEQMIDESGRMIEVHRSLKNTGSAFGNWSAAIERCKGTFVWIAEADDAADESFVESLIRGSSSRTTLAFCDSRQIDSAGNPTADSYRYYLDTFDKDFFSHQSTTDGPRFVKELLATRNCILNVSGVIFRTEALRQLFGRAEADIKSYRLAGDWHTYAGLLAQPDSEVVYVPKALNIHRRHESGVTQSLSVAAHVDEIRRVQSYIAEAFQITPQARQAQTDYREAVRIQLKEAAIK